MRRIYEFRVFDILKDKDNEKFLDMVKKENPELYSKFLNIVGNKGLDIAKEKYYDFRPDVVEKRKEKEKEEAKEKREKEREKEKEEFRQSILNKYKNEIEKIDKIILYDNTLEDIVYRMRNDDVIGKYLTDTRKRHTNLFKKLLKNIKRFSFKIKYTLAIDFISLIRKNSGWFGYKKNSVIVLLGRWYFKDYDKVTYSIKLDLYDCFKEDFYEKDKEILSAYIKQRNIDIKKLKVVALDKTQLEKTIFEDIKYLLGEEYYKEWKEEYIFNQDIDRYNI